MSNFREDTATALREFNVQEFEKSYGVDPASALAMFRDGNVLQPLLTAHVSGRHGGTARMSIWPRTARASRARPRSSGPC